MATAVDVPVAGLVMATAGSDAASNWLEAKKKIKEIGKGNAQEAHENIVHVDNQNMKNSNLVPMAKESDEVAHSGIHCSHSMMLM